MSAPEFHVIAAQRWFLDHLDEIRSRANACFFRLSPVEREEAVADVVASIFAQCVRAAARGVINRLTPYHLVAFTARQYCGGRRFTGSSTTDVMADGTRTARRVALRSLFDPRCSDPPSPRHEPRAKLAQTLSDVRSADPFHQARINGDYSTMLRQPHVKPTARRLFALMAQCWGHGSNMSFARELNVSPTRISQLKQQLARTLTQHDYAPRSVERAA